MSERGYARPIQVALVMAILLVGLAAGFSVSNSLLQTKTVTSISASTVIVTASSDQNTATVSTLQVTTTSVVTTTSFVQLYNSTSKVPANLNPADGYYWSFQAPVDTDVYVLFATYFGYGYVTVKFNSTRPVEFYMWDNQQSINETSPKTPERSGTAFFPTIPICTPSCPQGRITPVWAVGILNFASATVQVNATITYFY